MCSKQKVKNSGEFGEITEKTNIATMAVIETTGITA